MQLEQESKQPNLQASASSTLTQTPTPYSSAALTGDEIRVPEETEPDFELTSDFVSEVVSNTWLNPAKIADRMLTHYEYDMDFDATSKDMVEAIPEYFNDEQQQLMMEAKSQDHWFDLKEEFEAAAQYQEELRLGGPAAQFWAGAIGLFDPTALIALGVTEGAALGVLANGNKLRNLSIGTSALVSSGAGATSGSVYAALRSGQESDYSVDDAIIDMALGAGFSGVLGTTWTAYHKLGKTMLDEKMAKRNGEDIGDREQSMGAAKADDTYNPANPLDMTQNAQMKRSDSVEMREVADKLTSSGANPNGVAADATSDRLRTMGLSRLNKALDDSFKVYKKEAGVRPWQWFKERAVRKDFAQQAGRYMLEVEGGRVLNNYHPEVIKFAKSVDDLNATMGRLAQDAGISGFDDFVPTSGYFKRRWKFTGANEVTNAAGERISHGTMEKLIFQSLKKKVDRADWTAERKALVAKISTGFAHNLLRSYKTELKSIDEILFDPDGITEYLVEEVGMPIGEVQQLVTNAFKDASDDITKAQNLKGKKNSKRTNVYDRAKQRMDLDMTHEVNGFNLGMFIDTDLEKMSSEYVLGMSGHIAMAKHVGATNPRKRAEFKESLLQGVTMDKRGKVEELYDEVIREIYGKPMIDQGNKKRHRVGQQLRRTTFTTSMGMASLAALTELSTVIAENGLRATLKNVPMLGQITKAAFLRREGPQLIREVNAYNGAIGDEYLATMFQELDDIALKEGGSFADGVLNHTDIITHKMQRGMGYLSFLEPVDRTLKMMAFSTANTSIFDHLMKGTRSRFPFKDYGIDDDLKRSIKEQWRKHPPEVDKFGAVTRNHFDKWDIGVRDAYIGALYRANTMQVQKQLTGEKVAMFEGPWMKIMTQFRSFMIGSWAKHTLRTYGRLKSGEGREAAVIAQMVALPLAVTQYVARSYMQSMGREDQDEFLENRLRPEVIAATAVNYMPAMGVPMAALSTGTYVAGHNMPIFRSTGYRPDLFAAPVLDYGQSVLDTSAKVVGAAKGDNWDDSDWRNASRLVWFNNTLVGSAFINTMLHYND